MKNIVIAILLCGLLISAQNKTEINTKLVNCKDYKDIETHVILYGKGGYSLQQIIVTESEISNLYSAHEYLNSKAYSIPKNYLLIFQK